LPPGRTQGGVPSVAAHQQHTRFARGPRRLPPGDGAGSAPGFAVPVQDQGLPLRAWARGAHCPGVVRRGCGNGNEIAERPLFGVGHLDPGATGPPKNEHADAAAGAVVAAGPGRAAGHKCDTSENEGSASLSLAPTAQTLSALAATWYRMPLTSGTPACLLQVLPFQCRIWDLSSVPVDVVAGKAVGAVGADLLTGSQRLTGRRASARRQRPTFGVLRVLGRRRCR
jgi:hypothetical protein